MLVSEAPVVGSGSGTRHPVAAARRAGGCSGHRHGAMELHAGGNESIFSEPHSYYL